MKKHVLITPLAICAFFVQAHISPALLASNSEQSVKLETPSPSPEASPEPEEPSPSPEAEEPTPSPSPEASPESEEPMTTPSPEISPMPEEPTPSPSPDVSPMPEEPSPSPEPEEPSPIIPPDPPKTTMARIQEVVKTMAKPVLTATSATVTTVATASVGVTVATTPWHAMLPFFAFRKRRIPMGRIVDAETNMPIPSAVVTIFDEMKRPRLTTKTNRDGQFETLLPKGVYTIAVQHPSYSIKTSHKRTLLFPDEVLYTEENIVVESDEDPIPVVIPMKSVGTASWIRPRITGMLEEIRIIQARVALPLLLIGATLNTFLLFLQPSIFLLTLQALYALAIIFELALSRIVRRNIGKVRNAITKQPVGLALVRLIDKTSGKIVATKATLPKGHFLLTPSPGAYELQVAHSQHKPYTDTITVQKWNPITAKKEVEIQPV